MSTGRLRYIDVARGIAIISIILGHLGINGINRFVFTFHVPIFYFITGYYTKKQTNISAYIKKKARTLLVPYAVASILIIICAILLTIKRGEAGKVLSVAGDWIYAALYGAGDQYYQPFYIKSIGAIWFLWATFWGNLFLQLSLRMKELYRIVFISFLFFLGQWTRHFFWLPLSVQAGFCATLFMYIGYCVKICRPSFCNQKKEIKTALTVAALWVWISFICDFKSFWLVHCDIGRGAVDVIGCICACYCVLLFAKMIDKHVDWLAQPFAYFGRYSIIILCVHIIELNVLPWNSLLVRLNLIGLPVSYNIYYLIGMKMLLDLGLAVFLSKKKRAKTLLAID